MAILTAGGKESGTDDLQTRRQEYDALFDEMIDRLRNYATDKPENFALACIGIGFILGWKLKP